MLITPFQLDSTTEISLELQDFESTQTGGWEGGSTLLLNEKLIVCCFQWESVSGFILPFVYILCLQLNQFNRSVKLSKKAPLNLRLGRILDNLMNRSNKIPEGRRSRNFVVSLYL